MKRLEGRVALVTGAASGIGRASAKLFAAEGASVVAVDRAAEVKATAETIAADGGKAQAIVADAASEADIAAAVDKAVTDYGTLDIVFANAGISGGLKPFFELDADDWMNVLKVNLVGAFLGCEACRARHGAEGQGFDHLHRLRGGPAFGRRRRSLQREQGRRRVAVQTGANYLAGTGVRLNGICPGLIETGMTKPIFDYARAKGTGDRIGQLNPLRRYGEPEEIAQMALFLASDEASYVNGQVIAVDGGLSSSLPVKGRWA